MTSRSTTPDSGGYRLFSFDNSYARLPERFYARQRPTPVAAPRLVRANHGLAVELCGEPSLLHTATAAAVLAGNAVAAGSEPLAQAYAGHQFGGFVPRLGDGRAILLGEVIDRQGRRRDVQLKGSGPTPFSRRGDGRAALGPVLREYLVSEAMYALGIPTTRALAALTTGERLLRDAALPGAIIVRVAASHLRVGTFEYLAAQRDVHGLRTLVDYALARHGPTAAGDDKPALALVRAVMARQAQLVARWLGVGFVHGVMNTDNTAISGETLDFGPCAFMDAYDPATVFSSIDHGGRYAYGAQPGIVAWNMARLAEALLPVIDPDPARAVAAAEEAIAPLPELLEAAWLQVMRDKLGLTSVRAGDGSLIRRLLEAMLAAGADFTNGFRALCGAADGQVDAARAEFGASDAFDEWLPAWRARLADEASPAEHRGAAMRRVNPAVIPRNHLVEAALGAAVERDDYAPLDQLSAVLARPYDDPPERAVYCQPAPASAPRYRTFCGT